jgi:hypothetical protein
MKPIVYKNPRTLTPNQTKWTKRYTIKSGDDASFLEPPNEYHEVFEWDNGWIDYTVDDELFWIWSMYTNKPDMNIAMIDAFQYAVNLAKKNNCNMIQWDTSRPIDAWQKLATNVGKIEIVTQQLRVRI